VGFTRASSAPWEDSTVLLLRLQRECGILNTSLQSLSMKA